FSGEISGSYAESSAKFAEAASEKGQECFHASYIFPRAKVILDAYDLELSKSCEEFCKIRPFDIDGFYARFGIAFSCSILLGARLQSISDSNLFVQSTVYKDDEQKKAAFSASFSTPWASGSASGSYANRTMTDDKQKKTNISMSLQWEAQGGETYLSTNPAAWIRTVAPYHSWRIIQRDDMRNILDIVDSISPNILYSPAKYEVFGISIKKTWLLANCGYFIGCPFRNEPIQPGPKSDTPVSDIGDENQWIVEFVYDKEWITIANYSQRLEDTVKTKRLLYITPEDTKAGSCVKLTVQPYRWRIERDPDSSCVFIHLPASKSEEPLALVGVNNSNELSIQLQTLNRAKPEHQWVIKEGNHDPKKEPGKMAGGETK
ncbi:hypothetical protein AX17_004053, partial [Amanita inopinata Kibby_2008]